MGSGLHFFPSVSTQHSYTVPSFSACEYEIYCHLYYCSLSSYYSVLNKYLLLPKTVMLSAQAEKGEQRTLYILVSLGFGRSTQLVLC